MGVILSVFTFASILFWQVDFCLLLMKFFIMKYMSNGWLVSWSVISVKVFFCHIFVIRVSRASCHCDVLMIYWVVEDPILLCSLVYSLQHFCRLTGISDYIV